METAFKQSESRFFVTTMTTMKKRWDEYLVQTNAQPSPSPSPSTSGLVDVITLMRASLWAFHVALANLPATTIPILFRNQLESQFLPHLDYLNTFWTAKDIQLVEGLVNILLVLSKPDFNGGISLRPIFSMYFPLSSPLFVIVPYYV